MPRDTTRPVYIGVSTKMYMGYRQTLNWLGGVREQLDAVAADARPQGGTVHTFVAPSYPVLESAARILNGSGATLAAQNCAAGDGPLTGEVSASMLAELGVGMVEIGHAERRRLFGEDDAVIARKVSLATDAGLVPLLCIGEPERMEPERAAEHCAAQVGAALAEVPGAFDDAAARHGAAAAVAPGLILAYEPIWAIGAPASAPTDYINRVVTALRQLIGDATPILYGGSAGPGLLPQLPAVDGLFLGRFAHDPRQFGAVLREAHTLFRA